MCYGAITQSKASRLVCGTWDEEVCAIGSYEGLKLVDWVVVLIDRGTTVLSDILRDDAATVLQEYYVAALGDCHQLRLS